LAQRFFPSLKLKHFRSPVQSALSVHELHFSPLLGEQLIGTNIKAPKNKMSKMPGKRVILINFFMVLKFLILFI